MPLRGPEDRPTRLMDRYRERLSEEMKEHGETDRSLAKKVTDAGYPVSFTMINKTRSGNRQPSIDECNAVAWVFGYASLDAFLDGPATKRIIDAVAHLHEAFSLGVIQVRAQVQDALRDLRWALNDADAVAALDRQDPHWRESYAQVETDLRWVRDDQEALWDQTLKHVRELLPEPHEKVEDDASTQ